ncbi:MAG: RtcB family protein, partial [Oscillospiraceae bacterium]|nr:RtcB family protein [Oscillospiraceae bacterium]
MLTVSGAYTTAKIFTDSLEPSAEGQIRTMCDQPFMKGSKVRIMPDVHAGKGCTIGTTMTIGECVVPSMVGVDIGCGMETVKLTDKRLNLPELDNFIHQNIPCGPAVRDKPHRSHGRPDVSQLRCFGKLKNAHRIDRSLGTLGGGNHFIEVGKDDEGELYLVIHSGSRNVGNQVAKYYQDIAYNAVGGKGQKEVAYDLAYLTGEAMEDYLHDMKIMQAFAELNRKIMVEVILDGMKLKNEGSFTTIHNYIDTEAMILRKGAVSARAGEVILVPINMRDGSLICTGLGNADWNYSAPHGAGRLMSRTEANNSFTLSAFKKEMEGVFTSSVNRDTLDECPMAYKPMEDIVKHIGETATIDKVI